MRASQVTLMVKKKKKQTNPPANAGDARDRVQSLGREDPLRRAWQPTPVFLPGKPRGQRSRQATVHGVSKSLTRLSTHAHTARETVSTVSLPRGNLTRMSPHAGYTGLLWAEVLEAPARRWGDISTGLHPQKREH